MSEQTGALEQEVPAVPPAEEGATTPGAIQESGLSGAVISRPGSASRFLPAPPRAAEAAVVVGRGFLSSKASPQKQQLSRERVIAGDLPSWDPMPPGEIAVRRRARD